MRVLAIIPAYNEQESLLDTVKMVTSECPDIDYLVVDDGSSDGTAQVMRSSRLHGVSLPVNTGLTSGIRTGMKYAYRNGYDAAVQIDADGQHLPRYIAPMAQALEREGADIVIASRYLDGTVKPEGARGVGSRLISGLIRQTTGTTITDPTSGMRMYNRRMIELFAKGFDVAPEPDTVALVARKGGKVVEVPCTMRERQGGESYLKLGNAIKYMARTCTSILLFQWLR
ncbi:MAG: glycosyltransferase family 2 protein [Olsenella sp.]|mgnify:CR=1 FL=1|jgi:glycosyltransferase involved in cell wall biosynthesis|nr:glycosyltransferase family 2 protein [Olsenella sp.]